MKKIERKEIEDVFALTPMQNGILYHYLKNPGSEVFFEQLSIGINGKIDTNLFAQAWDFVTVSNAMLRTVFQWEKIKNPVQIVLREYRLQPEFHDLSNKKNCEKKIGINEIKAEDKERKFDLQEVSFRVILCKTADDKYEMIISNHHILYDGWSNGIILREFFSAYNDLVKGKRLVRPVKTGFKEFVKWMQNCKIPGQEKFWNDYLNNENSHETLPFTPKQRKQNEKINTGNYRIILPLEIKNKLKYFVKSHKITIASFLYSVWGLLLQHCNSTGDVIFDTTLSGRSSIPAGMEDVVGLFINTLPLRVRSDPDENIAGFLHRTFQMLKRWQEFENTPLDIVNEYLEKYYMKSLFDSVVVIENYPIEKVLLQVNGVLSAESFDISGMTSYDLTLIITLFDDIRFIFTYDSGKFSEETIAKLADDTIDIIKFILNNPQKKISELTELSQDVRGMILAGATGKELVDSHHRQRGEFSTGGVYAAPADRIEEKLVDIWSSLFRLQKDKIGIYTNFFDLGGHSLKASLLAGRIHKEFKVKLPLAEVFRLPTIRLLAEYIGKAGETKYDFLKAVEKKEYYELSSVQKRMYHIRHLEKAGTAYNVSFTIELQGPFDGEVLAAVSYAFNELIKRHESLRTSFQMIDGNPFQRIHPQVEFMIEEIDTNEDFIRPFDLSQAPLLRVGLTKIGKAKHLLIFDMHHIITDGFSMNIFIKEFNAIYKGENLPPLKFQYKDFSDMQNRLLRSRELKQQEDYWLNRFSGELPVLSMLTDFGRPALQSFSGGRVHFTLNKVLTRRLDLYIRETEVTLFILLLAVFSVLLHKYTTQEDIVIGSTVSGRDQADMEGIIGLFIETTALRTYPGRNKSFASFLQEVKEKTLTDFENAVYPFRELMMKVGDLEDLSRNPLFSAMLIVQNVDMAGLKMAGLKSSPVPFEPKSTKVDFTLEAVRENGEVRCHIEYGSKLYKRETMERMAVHLTNILERVESDSDVLLSGLEIMSETEKQQILEEFKTAGNNFSELAAGSDYHTVYELYECQARQIADGIALEYEDRQMTYRQLNEKVDALSKVIGELD